MIVRPVLCRRFIGRAGELAFLETKRFDAARSRGALVFVSGEAGIGKSRLIAEFASRIGRSRWRIASGACLEHAQRPYGPILDILARLEGTDEPVVPAPAATKREQHAALAARLTDAAQKRGVVAILEDLHWADSATLDVLGVLAASLDARRLLILASVRPNELPREHPSQVALAELAAAERAVRIDLHTLDDDERERFIDDALRDYRLPADARRAAAATSDGNPFFLEELLKATVDNGGTGVLPLSIRATLLERWQRLPAPDQPILAHAAIIGRSFDLDLLARTLDAPRAQILAALHRARDGQLVEEAESGFRFRHALTRDAIYSTFLHAERAPVHRKIARALEAAVRVDLSAVAYHWWAARDDERSAQYNVLAGDAAAAVYAHDDAVVSYRRALESSTLGAVPRAQIMEKLVDVYSALGSAQSAHDAIQNAADLYRSGHAYDNEAKCRARAAVLAYQLHLPEPTLPLVAMLERLGPNDRLARARVHLGLAWIKASRGYPTETSAHLAAVDPEVRDAYADLAIRYHNVASWNAMTLGDATAFVREHAAWVDACADASANALMSAHINGAWCYATFGLHHEATRQLDRAFALNERSRNLQSRESTYAFAAALCYLRGDLAGVRRALDGVSPTTENQVNLCHAAAWGTLTGFHLGDRELSDTWYAAIGDDNLAAVEEICGAGFAESLVRADRPRDAADVLHRAIPDCELMRGNLFTLLAAARYGTPVDVRRARAQLARAAQAPSEVPEMHALRLFDAYTAIRAERFDDAVTPARAAAAGFSRLDFPLLQAAALEAAGDVDAARAVFAVCGATGDVDRLSHTPGRALAATEPLSPRELQIARMVATGSSNKEIAAQFAITVKTVEKHVAGVYRKVGFRSRSRLAVYMNENGSVEVAEVPTGA